MDNDVQKHKKKSKKKPPKKAKHKHEYVPCVLWRNGLVFDKAHGPQYTGAPQKTIGTYCPVCGKIGDTYNWDWMTIVEDPDPPHPNISHRVYDWNDEAKKQFDEETRTIPIFKTTEYFQKFVDLEELDD